jgi:hypothetical protein
MQITMTILDIWQMSLSWKMNRRILTKKRKNYLKNFKYILKDGVILLFSFLLTFFWMSSLASARHLFIIKLTLAVGSILVRNAKAYRSKLLNYTYQRWYLAHTFYTKVL